MNMRTLYTKSSKLTVVDYRKKKKSHPRVSTSIHKRLSRPRVFQSIHINQARPRVSTYICISLSRPRVSTSIRMSFSSAYNIYTQLLLATQVSWIGITIGYK